MRPNIEIPTCAVLACGTVHESQIPIIARPWSPIVNSTWTGSFFFRRPPSCSKCRNKEDSCSTPMPWETNHDARAQRAGQPCSLPKRRVALFEQVQQLASPDVWEARSRGNTAALDAVVAARLSGGGETRRTSQSPAICCMHSAYQRPRLPFSSVQCSTMLRPRHQSAMTVVRYSTQVW